MVHYPKIVSLHKKFYQGVLQSIDTFLMGCTDTEFQRFRRVCEQVIRLRNHVIAYQAPLPNQRQQFLDDVQHRHGLWKDALEYQPLRDVILEFGNKSLRQSLEEYEDLLRVKGNTALLDCQRESKKCPETYLKLKAKHNTTLATLLRLKTFLVEDVGLDDASFAGFREGCVELFFEMSPESASSARDQLQLQEFRSKLLSLGVKRVKFEGLWVITTDMCSGNVTYIQVCSCTN